MRYKLELEFESNLSSDSIKKWRDLILPGCLPDPIENTSINITPEETVTITKEEYEDLVSCANYVYHWGYRPVKCKKCGNLNPGNRICGYDDSTD